MDSKPPDELKEKWLWIDPFGTDTRVMSGAVLLAEDILRYVNEFNVLLDQSDFSKGKLKGASYTMTPHPSDAWMFDESAGQVRLAVREDSKGPYYVVPKHSLVFIKLRQRLRIPFYVIGRHNLKISYVYQGLLLGTGPQVDPGYVGNLIIPLHNLTTEVVKIHINESFVSIDFVRTTPMALGDNPPETLKELYSQYGSDKCLLEMSKVTSRVNLSDYLGNATPQSAMQEFLKNYTSTKAELERTKITLDESLRRLETQRVQYEERISQEVDKRVGKLENVQKETQTILQESQKVLETKLTQQLEKAEGRHRIEMFVVAGLLVATVLGIVIPIICWVRDYYGEFNGRLFTYEQRLSNVNMDHTNTVDKMYLQISNSLSALCVKQALVVSTLSDAEMKINKLEVQVTGLTGLVSRIMSTNSATNTAP